MKAKAKKPAPTKPKRTRFCLEQGCKQPATAQAHCRKHYIINWKHIQFDNQVRAEKRLNAYVNRLAEKYPKDYIEKIKEGLESEEKFKETLDDLNFENAPEINETDREYLEKFRRTFKIGNE